MVDLQKKTPFFGFERALELMKAGEKVSREAWCADEFLFLDDVCDWKEVRDNRGGEVETWKPIDLHAELTADDWCLARCWACDTETTGGAIIDNNYFCGGCAEKWRAGNATVALFDDETSLSETPIIDGAEARLEVQGDD